MNYKQYGNLGFEVSSVGFGGMRFDTSLPEQENVDLLRYAFDKGVTYFDTAPGYSEDQSEIIYGKAFEQMKAQRDRYYVSTKGMPTDFDTADKAIAAVEKSLSRLKVDTIDFYHIWCLRKPEHYELAMQPGGQYEGLLKCQQRGLIQHIVCSTHMPGEEIKGIVRDGKVKGILMGINALNFMYRWDGVEAAHQAGLAVVAMNPLGGGLIPKNEQEFAFLSQHGEGATQAALRFCIGSPEITVTLVGFTTREHIDAACEAAEKAKTLSPEDLESLKSNLSLNFNRLCTGCGYCMGLCPKDIPVASYMMFYNHKLISNPSEKEIAKNMDFDHNWGILVGRKAEAGVCIACGRCEQACTQHLDIVNRLKELARIEETLA